MAVYDRWHRDPEPGDRPCACSRGRNKLYPGAEHLRGDRWQVRYRHPDTGKQKKKNFALRDPGPGELADPDRHASAYDAAVQGSIVTRNYADPNAGNVLLRDYCEEWRKGRGGTGRAKQAREKRLLYHVYEDPKRPDSSLTPMGGVSIGQHQMGLIGQRPSILAAWVTGMPLAEGSKRKVWDDVAAMLAAATEDGVIRRNPALSSSVKRPARGGIEAVPFTAAEIGGIAAGMPARYRILPDLGARTGMRQMEMSGLGADDVHRAGKRPRVHVARQLLSVEGELYFAPLKARRKPRSVPLAPSLDVQLEEHMRLYPPVAVTLPWYEPDSKLHGQPHTVRLVLTRADRTPLTRGSSDAAWRTAVVRMLAAKLPGGKRAWPRSLAAGQNMHRTRHTYASAQLRAGVDVVRLAKWMGDTVQEIVATYLHQLPGDDDEADGRAAVDAFFGPTPGGGSSALDVPQGRPTAARELAGAV